MQRCPCCHARLHDGLCCPRCKADLKTIARVRKMAASCYKKALVCYQQGDLDACLQGLNRSLQLRHSDSACLFRDFVRQRQNREAARNLYPVATMWLAINAWVRHLWQYLSNRYPAYWELAKNKIRLQGDLTIRRLLFPGKAQ